nr:RES domain-containing protein [uncultured Draconibacterium sp.]
MDEKNKNRIYDDYLFEKYSNVDSFIIKIEEFDKLDLTSKNSKEIGQLYFEYFPLIPYIWFGQKIERFNKHIFYRVRKNINENEEAINLTSTYSYPSSKLCEHNGRANRNGKSVFYCSDNAITAIMECQLKTGDIGYLSIWKPDAKREMRIQYSLPRHLRPDNKWNEVRKDIHPLIEQHLIENYKEKKELYIALINYLFKKFISEKFPYPLTSWLADNYLYSENWIDILLYPSVAGGQKDCNMAIHPNSVDDNIKFKKVIKFRVVDAQVDKIAYRPISVGELKNQNIVWRKAQKDEKDFSKFE